MKISAIKTLVVNAEMRNWVFVKVETDHPGLYGWGEATLEWKTRSVVSAVDDIAELLIGEDPRQIGRILSIMRKQSFWRLGAIGLSAVSAIDTALWDISGKELGVPVWRLLGGKVRDKVRVYTHLGMGRKSDVYHTFDIEPLLARCDELRAKGYTAAKIVNVPYTHYLTRIKQVDEFSRSILELRASVGDEFEIMIDFHGRPASARAALDYIDAISDARPLFIEEPIQPGDTEGLKHIRNHSRVPVASGERLVEPQEFGEVLSRRAVDVIQPDLCHCGGLSEGKRIAGIAEVFGIGVAPHNPAGPIAGAAALHFAASTPNHLIQEEMVGAVPWYDEVVPQSPIVRTEGHWCIPDAPGLGIEIDETLATRHPFAQESMEPRNAVLGDGTIVDW